MMRAFTLLGIALTVVACAAVDDSADTGSAEGAATAKPAPASKLGMPCTNRWTDCDQGQICPKSLGRCAVGLGDYDFCDADDQCLSQYCAYQGPGYQHGQEHHCIGPDATIPEQGQKCGGLLSGDCKAGLTCRAYTLPKALWDEHMCEP